MCRYRTFVLSYKYLVTYLVTMDGHAKRDLDRRVKTQGSVQCSLCARGQQFAEPFLCHL